MAPAAAGLTQPLLNPSADSAGAAITSYSTTVTITETTGADSAAKEELVDADGESKEPASRRALIVSILTLLLSIPALIGA